MRGRAWVLRAQVLRTGALLVALAGGTEAGRAQEPGEPAESRGGGEPPHGVLTLERARFLAMENNPAYRRALNDLTLEGPLRQRAWGQWLPALDLSAGTNQSFVRQEVGTDDFGNPIPNPDVETRYNSSSSQGLGLNVDLFNGRNLAAFSQTAAQVELRVRSAERAMVTLLAEVDRQYFAAQGRLALVALEETVLEGRRRDLEATDRLFLLAARNRADVLAAQLAVRQQERALQNARAEYRKARLALQRALGQADLGPFTLEAEPPAIFDPSILDVDALVEQALRTNPAVLEEEARIGLSRANLSIARSSRWPVVSLAGGVTRSAFGPDQSAFFDLTPEAQANGSLGLRVSLPVFQRFSPAFEIADARVEVANAQEDRRERALEVETDVRERLIDLENAFVNVGLQEASLALARERLALSREEYQLATVTFTDLQLAVSDEAQARRDFIRAQFDFLAARVALEEAVGRRLDLPTAPEP